MSLSQLTLLEQLSLLLIGLAILISLLRFLLGPAAPDRLVAADTLVMITIIAIVAVALWFGSAFYLDVALIYGTLAFVGIVAIARAIEGGRK